MRLSYGLFDPDPSTMGQKLLKTALEQKNWNEKGWGIFQTVNAFSQETRKKQYVKEILYWAVDIDLGSKEEQLSKIKKNLLPSIVVETKRGYQVYWRAKNARIENWNKIVWDRLLFHFGADKNAKDITRILRVPGFYHCKDPNDKFLIKTVWEDSVSYTEDEMFLAFPLPEKEERHSEIKENLRVTFKESDDLWERVWSLDCKTALEKISGHNSVGSEIFSFKQTTDGKFNILVDGKGTSCWIDQNKKIGSLDGGGPTIFQWIKWYTKSNKETIRVMKEVFPELWNKN